MARGETGMGNKKGVRGMCDPFLRSQSRTDCPSCEAIFVIEAPKPPPKPRPKSTGPVKPTPIVEDDPKETKDDEAELLKTAGIEEDDSDDSEEDGVVGDVFVEDDDEEDDVTNVLDAPVAKPTNE